MSSLEGLAVERLPVPPPPAWLRGWHLNRVAERMQARARTGRRGDSLRARALKQAGRELLLAQASDWAFIIRTGTLLPYAVQRAELHLERFGRLDRALSEERYDPADLSRLESVDPVFPDLDPGLFP